MIEEDREEMDGVLRKFRISLPEDECVVKLQEYCKFSLTLLKVPVVSKPLCGDSNCHNNVNHYVSTYGGEKISGYYLITDVDDETYTNARNEFRKVAETKEDKKLYKV